MQIPCAMSRHAKNRVRRYVKYGITVELVLEAVREQATVGDRGEGQALVASSVGQFRVAFVVEERGVTVKTVLPPRRSRF